ncbi:MAG: hypothetical protein SF069_03950 [Phycisphaerae bacterium]|nr:hypothetical protein [Phycisphaerae bacterium]
MANTGDSLPEIQFDKVQPVGGAGAAGVACASCQKPIGDFYFEWGQRPYCAPCKDKTIAAATSGWGGWRLMKAVIFGVIAGGVGALIYWGVGALTGYELGIVAIVVGWLVGVGVKVGSGGRGGWLYQIVAILLTYLAIAWAYGAPMIISVATGEYDLSQLGSLPTDSQPTEMSPLTAIVILLVAVPTLPVLVASQSPMAIIIIGIALWQAWSICRRTQFNFAGPFSVSSPSPPMPPVPSASPSPEQPGA